MDEASGLQFNLRNISSERAASPRPIRVPDSNEPSPQQTTMGSLIMNRIVRQVAKTGDICNTAIEYSRGVGEVFLVGIQAPSCH